MAFYDTFGFLIFWYIIFTLLYKIFKGIWTCWLGDLLGFTHKLAGGEKSWAIITGSTDGIGLKYAEEMANRGYNLLLISRNSEKLADRKNLIENKCPKVRSVRTLAADFSKLDIYDSIEKEIKIITDSRGKIEVLINNVGMSFPCADYFTKVEGSWETIESVINVNMYSCTKMTHLVLPLMLNEKKGVILNVSSLSGSYPMPFLSSYSAAKSYVDFFSRALQFEYRDKGIVIQSILPAYVATNMSKIRKTSLLVASPGDYVKSALKTVGLEDRTYGYWSHKIQGFFHDHLIPTFVYSDYNSTIAFNSLKQVRKRYYKKYGIKDD